jgi:carbon storage regulator CsrA
MLVLARRLNERIVIPCIQAAIQVVGIQGGIVRLGIEAPTDVKIFREEVVQDGRATASTDDVAPGPDDVRRRLANTARDLSELRSQLRGKLSASAAATLFRIDRDLGELARRIDRPADEAVPGAMLTVPVTR